MRLIIFLLFFSTFCQRSIAWAADVVWVVEQEMNYSVDPHRLHASDIQIAFSFAAPEVTKVFWSSEVDGLDATKNKDGKLLTVKSAFLLHRGMKELVKIFDTASVTELEPNIKIKNKEADNCVNAQSTQSVLFIPIDISFTLLLEKDKNPPPSDLDKNLGKPAFTLIQDCFLFSSLIDSSSSTLRLYPIDERTTLAVYYQVLRVKQSTMDLTAKYPIVDIKNMLVDKMKGSIQDFAYRLNRYPLKQY